MVVERVPMLHVPLLPPHAEAVGNHHTVVAARHMVVAADNPTAAAALTSN